MFTFNIYITSDNKVIEAIYTELQETKKIMSEIYDKVVGLEAAVDTEVAQGAAILVQVADLKALSEGLQAEVVRLNDLLAQVPNVEEVPLIMEALERLNTKVMGIIPDGVA